LFKKAIITGMMLLGIMSVSSCGKKPPRVDAPSGKENDTFPLIYPDPQYNK
jgi:hypothetical protein